MNVTTGAGPSSSPPPALQFRLVPVDPSGRTFCFGEEGARLGRDAASCDFAFSLKDISRLHCVFSFVGGKLYVRDVSFNGTFVNGRQVGRDRSAEVVEGDMISIVNPFLPHAASFSYTLALPRNPAQNASLPVGLTSPDVLERYVIGAVVGKGSYAVVYAATDKISGEAVAIKVLDKSRFTTSVVEESLRLEAELIRSLQHPNIVKVYDTYDTEEMIAIVMELVPGGDLFDYIVGRGKTPFTEEEARTLFLQIVEPVRYMHLRKILHCDLKPENILVARRSSAEDSEVPVVSESTTACSFAQSGSKNLSPYNVQLKLADFGVAKYCTRRAQHATGAVGQSADSPTRDSVVVTPTVGTPAYAAPELLGTIAHSAESGSGGPSGLDFPVSAAADMWSLGVLLYNLCSGCRPKRRAGVREAFVFHKHADSSLSAACKEVLTQLLMMNPAERMTMEGLLRHPWICEERSGERELSGAAADDWSLTASPVSPRYSTGIGPFGGNARE